MMEPKIISAYVIIKTLFLILTWGCLGLFSEITGVTLQDLRERTQSNYETIGQAVSMRMCGYGAGAIFGGWLLDKLTTVGDLVIGISLTVAAVVCVAIAHTPYVEVMFLEFSIQGVMETWIAIAGQQSLIHLWKEKSSGPMHILHLGYGIGSFSVAQIAKPFLSQRADETSSQFYINNCVVKNSTVAVNHLLTEQNITSMGTDSSGENHFEYAYYIITGIILLISLVYYIFYCLNHRQIEGFHTLHTTQSEKKKVKEIFNFNACSPGHPFYAAGIFFFLIFWFYIAVGGQMVFANYLFSYCRDIMCLEKSKAANIQSTFWIGFSAGRFVGFVTAIWLPMKYIIFIEAFGNLISAIVLYFNPSNMTIIWIFSCISGLFVGPLYPSGIAWANRYLTMTGLAYTITLISGSLAGVSFTIAIGWYFEHHGPGAFLYFVLGYSVIACLTATCMHLIARTRGDKYERGEGEVSAHQESEKGIPLKELGTASEEKSNEAD